MSGIERLAESITIFLLKQPRFDKVLAKGSKYATVLALANDLC